jgi:hypothetical protein
MKLRPIAMVIFLTAICLVVSGCNQGYSVSAVKNLPAVHKTVAGKVIDRNSLNSTLTVSTGPKKSLVIIVNKDTTIDKFRKSISLKSIKTGDNVLISYEAKDGKNTANYIGVIEG